VGSAKSVCGAGGLGILVGLSTLLATSPEEVCAALAR
jgi:hypothetical protein